MLSKSRILFPVDFSPQCSEMVPYVKAFAAIYKAEILLLHVINPVYMFPDMGVAQGVIIPAPVWILTNQAERMEEFGRTELDGLAVQRLVYEGEPEAQIVQTAKNEHVQLVAMPTHGYGRFRRFLIGSVTAKVLHDLECPMLTGTHREGSSTKAHVRISNVVCAVDLGSSSCDTLRWAFRLCKDFQASLSIVHVVSNVDAQLRGLFLEELRDQLIADIREEIRKLGAADVTANYTISVEEGDAAQVICSTVKEAAANLLVIGRSSNTSSNGRLKSKAYEIIRQSPCPVFSL